MMADQPKVFTSEIDWPRTKCMQKERYETEAEALRQVEILKHTTNEPWAKAQCLNAYQCKWCEQWHVGHDWSKMPRTSEP